MADKNEPGAPPAATRTSADVKSNLIPVVFLRKSPPYNKNEIAGFSADVAEGLEKQKIARKLSPAEVKSGKVESN